jgi:hypothetical protein
MSDHQAACCHPGRTGDVSEVEGEAAPSSHHLGLRP